MWVQVAEMPLEKLAVRSQQSAENAETKTAREQVRKARALQKKRFAGTTVATNAGMRAKEIAKLAELSPKAESALLQAAARLKLSPRGYHRTIKLARTIADLAASVTIETAHMLEALQYRAREL